MSTLSLSIKSLHKQWDILVNTVHVGICRLIIVEMYK